MLALVKSKIMDLRYKDSESVSDLRKLINITTYAISDDSKTIYPIQPEYVEALTVVGSIRDNALFIEGEQDFDNLKARLLDIYAKLEENIAHRSYKVPQPLFSQPDARQNQLDRIKFALWMVQEDNIDFFRSRPPKLSSLEHDQLSSHYFIREHDGFIEFGFIEPSVLPDYIREEAKIAFMTAAAGTSIN